MSFNLINLLPERKKDGLDKLVKFLFCKEILEVVLLTSAFLSITLLWGWIILQENFTNLSQSALSVNKEFSHYNQDVRKINLALKKLNASSLGFSPITSKIVEFINKLPADIKLNSLNLNRETGTFEISGIAKNRDILISFQSLLQSLDWLENVQSPTSQLFQKQNINFDIKAKIKNISLIEAQKNTSKTANSSGE